MCDHSGEGFMGPFIFRGMHGHRKRGGMMCCPPFEQSKETTIKQLEAMKSHLEDYITQIDKQIEELQIEEKEEA